MNEDQELELSQENELEVISEKEKKRRFEDSLDDINE